MRQVTGAFTVIWLLYFLYEDPILDLQMLHFQLSLIEQICGSSFQVRGIFLEQNGTQSVKTSNYSMDTYLVMKGDWNIDWLSLLAIVRKSNC